MTNETPKYKKIFKSVISVGKQLNKRVSEADVFGLSAQLAYFFLLALFPFLFFLVTLLGYLPLDEQVVADYINLYLPDEVANMINTNMSQLLNSRSGGLLSLSVIGTIWSASKGFNAITKSLNSAYRVKESRSFIIARLISIGLTIAMFVVICVALLLPVFGQKIGTFLFSFINLSDGFLTVWNTLRWVISSATFFIVFLVLYKLAPNKKITFKHTIWGAIFATLGWQLASFGFSYYVNTLGDYSATYGSLGTVIILMIWLYLSGVIITSGGVLNAYLMNRKNVNH